VAGSQRGVWHVEHDMLNTTSAAIRAAALRGGSPTASAAMANDTSDRARASSSSGTHDGYDGAFGTGPLALRRHDEAVISRSAPYRAYILALRRAVRSVLLIS
jgi:hypothetical protein